MEPISADSDVADLVLAVPSRARVFEELGIDYCCGGRKSLAVACRTRGLDTGWHHQFSCCRFLFLELWCYRLRQVQ